MAHRIETVPLKIVIVGDGACGKSALLLAYTQKKYNDAYIPTGENRQLKLTVLDTAGQEDFKNIRNLATRGADVCILCYSVDNVNSLDNAKSNWVPEIKHEDATLPFVLVGNKADMFNATDPEHVPVKQARKMARKLGAYCAIQCSAKQYGLTRGEKGRVDKVFRASIKCGLIKKGAINSGKCGCTVL